MMLKPLSLYSHRVVELRAPARVQASTATTNSWPGTSRPA